MFSVGLGCVLGEAACRWKGAGGLRGLIAFAEFVGVVYWLQGWW